MLVILPFLFLAIGLLLNIRCVQFGHDFGGDSLTAPVVWTIHSPY